MNSGTIHEVKWQGQIIRFELLRKKVRHINLNLKPDMSIMVSANDRVPLEVILAFVKSKARWIIRNTRYFRATRPESIVGKEYVSGESFKYLGKQLRLKVCEGSAEGIRYYRGYLELTVFERGDIKRNETLVEQWFRNKACYHFNQALERMYPLLGKYDVAKPDIEIRTMKARWGSCIRDRQKIIVNAELIKAPKYCIDYVVLHELIHFRYRDHNAAFYGFLSSLMPDWQERKRVLDEEVVRSL